MRLITFLFWIPLLISMVPQSKNSFEDSSFSERLSSDGIRDFLADDFYAESLIVRVNNLDKTYAKADFSDISCQRARDLYTNGGKRILLLSIPKSSKTQIVKKIDKLLHRDDVIYAEPDVDGRWYATTPPELSNGIGNSFWYISSMDLLRAWDLCKRSTAKVGVIDTGIMASHPDFNVGRVDANLSESFSVNGGPLLPDHPHGTWVASLIGASGKNTGQYTGTCGVCFDDAKIVSLRADGPIGGFFDYDVSISQSVFSSNGSSYYANHPYFEAGTCHEKLSCVVSAIQYAEEHSLKILNFSGGFVGFPSQSLLDAINDYSGLIVCPIGDTHAPGSYAAGVDLDNCSDYEKIYPACYTCNNILTVGGIDSTNDYWYQSHYGSSSCDVFAPATNIYVSDYRYSWYGNTGVGTSLSAALVSGLASLLKTVKPSATTAEIKSAIINSCDARNSLASKCVSGGKVNAFKALLSFLPSLTCGTASVQSPTTLWPLDQVWFKINAFAGSYLFSTVGGYQTAGTLYSYNPAQNVMTEVAYSDEGGAGTNFELEYSFTSPGTYYMRVTNLGTTAQTVILHVQPSHVHSFTNSYLWDSNTKHRAYCTCSEYQLKGHVVSSANLHLCLQCNGYASSGFIVMGTGNTFIINGAVSIGNDSFLTPDGILILGPIDLARFVQGSITPDELIGVA